LNTDDIYYDYKNNNSKLSNLLKDYSNQKFKLSNIVPSKENLKIKNNSYKKRKNFYSSIILSPISNKNRKLNNNNINLTINNISLKNIDRINNNDYENCIHNEIPLSNNKRLNVELSNLHINGEKYKNEFIKRKMLLSSRNKGYPNNFDKINKNHEVSPRLGFTKCNSGNKKVLNNENNILNDGKKNIIKNICSKNDKTNEIEQNNLLENKKLKFQRCNNLNYLNKNNSKNNCLYEKYKCSFKTSKTLEHKNKKIDFSYSKSIKNHNSYNFNENMNKIAKHKYLDETKTNERKSKNKIDDFISAYNHMENYNDIKHVTYSNELMNGFIKYNTTFSKEESNYQKSNKKERKNTSSYNGKVYIDKNNIVNLDSMKNINLDKPIELNYDFINKLSALLHDFKHIVYDNLIYFDYLILKYIQPLIFNNHNSPRDFFNTDYNNLNNPNFKNNDNFNHLNTQNIDVNIIKDDLIYLSVIKDFTISLILNITSFMSDREFLSGNINEEVDIIKIVNLMTKIFKRRLEYENAMISNIEINLQSQRNSNLNLNTNIINKKDIIINSKINNYDCIMNCKIISNQNLIICLLYNIISNSYKYTNSGEICIEVDYQKLDQISYILIKISDTGIGITEEILKNWGKPFNFKDKTMGTGLGQFLIDSISRKLGIKMLLPEKNIFSPSGTVFKVLIPVSFTKKINTVSSNRELNEIIFHNDLSSHSNNKSNFDNNDNFSGYIINHTNSLVSIVNNSCNFHVSLPAENKLLIPSYCNFKNKSLSKINSLNNNMFDINNPINNESNFSENNDSISTKKLTEFHNIHIDDRYRRLSLFNNFNFQSIISQKSSNNENILNSYKSNRNSDDVNFFNLNNN